MTPTTIKVNFSLQILLESPPIVEFSYNSKNTRKKSQEVEIQAAKLPGVE